MKNYIQYQNLYFTENTPLEVKDVIERAYVTKERLIFDFGDVKTKISWNETYDVCGYIGRSTGKIKIPLLVHNKRSLGGGELSTENILTIKTSLGKHLKYYRN